MPLLTSFSNLSIEEASVVVGNKAETSGVDSFSISDDFSALTQNVSLVVNAPNGYEISNYDVTKSTVSGALDIGTDNLTVEEATLYFGASNGDFATPLNNGPTYNIQDLRLNIVDGENNGSEARSGIFNASEVVANGLGPDLTVAETKVILALGNFAGTSDVDVTDSAVNILSGDGVLDKPVWILLVYLMERLLRLMSAVH